MPSDLSTIIARYATSDYLSLVNIEKIVQDPRSADKVLHRIRLDAKENQDLTPEAAQLLALREPIETELWEASRPPRMDSHAGEGAFTALLGRIPPNFRDEEMWKFVAGKCDALHLLDMRHRSGPVCSAAIHEAVSRQRTEGLPFNAAELCGHFPKECSKDNGFMRAFVLEHPSSFVHLWNPDHIAAAVNFGEGLLVEAATGHSRLADFDDARLRTPRVWKALIDKGIDRAEILSRIGTFTLDELHALPELTQGLALGDIPEEALSPDVCQFFLHPLAMARDWKAFASALRQVRPVERREGAIARVVGDDQSSFKMLKRLHKALGAGEDRDLLLYVRTPAVFAASAALDQTEFIDSWDGDELLPQVLELLHQRDPGFFQTMGHLLNWAPDWMKSDLKICRDAVSDEIAGLPYVHPALKEKGPDDMLMWGLECAQDDEQLKKLLEETPPSRLAEMEPLIQQKLDWLKVAPPKDADAGSN